MKEGDLATEVEPETQKKKWRRGRTDQPAILELEPGVGREEEAEEGE